MTIKDRLTRGLLAGIAGGIAMAVPDLVFDAVDWVEHAYYDWALSLIRGSTANTIFEAFIGQVAHIFFAGLLGIVFAYAVLLVSSRNFLLKGWLFGILVWFSVHVTVNLFGFEPLAPIPTSQMIADFVTASIYGAVLAATLRRLGREKVRQS